MPVPRDLLSAGIDLDADIEVERQHRMEALKAELCAMAAQGNFANAIDRMMGIVLGLEQENERMSWRLLRALRYRFGRNTEKLAPVELKQLYLALGGDAAAPTPAGGPLVPVPTAPTEELNADGEVAAPNSTSKKRRKRKVGGATVVDDKVEKIVTKVPVPEEERTCALCGGAKTVFETVEHQRIEFVPAKVVLHIEQREKMTCLACRKDVSIAPRTQAPAVIRKVGSSFLAKLLTDKCALGFPMPRAPDSPSLWPELPRARPTPKLGKLLNHSRKLQACPTARRLLAFLRQDGIQPGVCAISGEVIGQRGSQ